MHLARISKKKTQFQWISRSAGNYCTLENTNYTKPALLVLKIYSAIYCPRRTAYFVKTKRVTGTNLMPIWKPGLLFDEILKIEDLARSLVLGHNSLIMLNQVKVNIDLLFKNILFYHIWGVAAILVKLNQMPYLYKSFLLNTRNYI